MCLVGNQVIYQVDRDVTFCIKRLLYFTFKQINDKEKKENSICYIMGKKKKHLKKEEVCGRYGEDEIPRVGNSGWRLESDGLVTTMD